MAIRIVAILILISFVALLAPQAHAFSFNFINKIVKVFKTLYRYYKIVSKYAAVPGYIPHGFSFGGHILSSERACSLKWINWATCPLCFGLAVPIPGYYPFPDRAIVVGPPAPSYNNVCVRNVCSNGIFGPCRTNADCGVDGGKIIEFPYITEIYRNKTEGKRCPRGNKLPCPWALGNGFTPFPIDKVNDALDAVIVTIPPGQALNPAACTAVQGYSGIVFCADHFHIDCSASGEKDKLKKDIYKVILKIGTSPELLK